MLVELRDNNDDEMIRVLLAYKEFFYPNCVVCNSYKAISSSTSTATYGSFFL
jgi:hypothetical protein